MRFNYCQCETPHLINFVGLLIMKTKSENLKKKAKLPK